jgi:lysophospholipase L1-like esterase
MPDENHAERLAHDAISSSCSERFGSAVTDRRLLFFGDSLVAGVGDPTGAGWVGRVVATSFASGLGLTAYNLGIRGETSEQIASRWRTEALPRLLAGAAGRDECYRRVVCSTTQSRYGV